MHGPDGDSTNGTEAVHVDEGRPVHVPDGDSPVHVSDAGEKSDHESPGSAR